MTRAVLFSNAFSPGSGAFRTEPGDEVVPDTIDRMSTKLQEIWADSSNGPRRCEQ